MGTRRSMNQDQHPDTQLSGALETLRLRQALIFALAVVTAFALSTAVSVDVNGQQFGPTAAFGQDDDEDSDDDDSDDDAADSDDGTAPEGGADTGLGFFFQDDEDDDSDDSDDAADNEDSDDGAAPAGGADTGFGGMAEDDGFPVTPTALAAAAVLGAAGVATTRLRTSRS